MQLKTPTTLFIFNLIYIAAIKFFKSNGQLLLGAFICSKSPRIACKPKLNRNGPNNGSLLLLPFHLCFPFVGVTLRGPLFIDHGDTAVPFAVTTVIVSWKIESFICTIFCEKQNYLGTFVAKTSQQFMQCTCALHNLHSRHCYTHPEHL